MMSFVSLKAFREKVYGVGVSNMKRLHKIKITDQVAMASSRVLSRYGQMIGEGYISALTAIDCTMCRNR